jgi:predicted transcriptional regulator
MFEAVVSILFILLVFAMYVMIAGSSPVVMDKWNTTAGPMPYLYTGDNGTLYVFTGNNITSMAPDGTVKWSLSIPNGWTCVNEWTIDPIIYPTNMIFNSNLIRPGTMYMGTIQSGYRPESAPAVASSNGVLYVYIRPSFYFNNSPYDGNLDYGLERTFGENWSEAPFYARLMAISPDGNVLWIKPLDNVTNADQDTSWLPIQDIFISTSGNRIYVYHPNSLSVLDNNGSFLFSIDNVSDAAAVDEIGDIFTVTPGDDGQPSNEVIAYYSNGTMWWKDEMNEPVKRQMLETGIEPEYWTLPIYANDTLYVSLQNSLVALDKNGNMLWTDSFNWSIELLWDMPFDSQNNAYLLVNNEPTPGNDNVVWQYVMVAPDGKTSSYSAQLENDTLLGASDGIGYYADTTVQPNSSTGTFDGPSSLNDLGSFRINAVDFKTGVGLWNFTIPIANISVITLNQSNVHYLDELSPLNSLWGNSGDTSSTMAIEYNQEHPEFQNMSKSALGPWKINGDSTVSVMPAGNVVYISYYTQNYEYPLRKIPPYDDGSEAYNDAMKYGQSPIFNRSELAYSGGVIALNNNGQMLWDQTTDSMVTAMAANNSTIYYSTENGKLSATRGSIAAGLALVAAIYIFFRFFLVGAVARARDRLDKNKNRNSVYRYVVENPGLTLREVSRGLHMNLGTIRYHIMVLALNHKVISYMADDKHVRYFSNSNSYSKEEQFVISLARRDSIRKILSLLLEKPGMTNTELSGRLGIHVSETSRYMKELSEKGLIFKMPLSGGSYAYSIRSEQAQRIATSIERLSHG